MAGIGINRLDPSLPFFIRLSINFQHFFVKINIHIIRTFMGERLCTMDDFVNEDDQS
jgi:hypothetical protein